MSISFIRSYQVSKGTISGESTPETPDELYASPDELGALYGCEPDEGSIRFAQSIVNTICNRTSLWPCEYEYQLEIPAGRQETRIPITPVIKVTALAGRFSQGRRDNMAYNGYQAGIAAYLMITGARPSYTEIPVSACEVDPATGVVWLQSSYWLVQYNMVRITAVSGYITIPDRVKAALAEIINSVQNKGQSDRMFYASGRVSRKYASDSFVTPMVRQFLQPFIVSALF